MKERKERDALVRSSVLRLKMTAGQVYRFSRAWQNPFYSAEDVWRRVVALGLERKIRHRVLQSDHDEDTLEVFIKIACDAVRKGLPIFEIAKEYVIGEESGIRTDMRFRIFDPPSGKSYLRYLETQRSVLTYQGWKAKLRKYVRYRKRPDVKPFRVLIVMKNEHDLNTVLGYAKEVMRDHPNLTLFYFALMQDLLGQYNVVTEDVWRSHRFEAVTLIPV